MTGNFSDSQLIDMGESAVKDWVNYHDTNNCRFSFLLSNGSAHKANGHACHGSLMSGYMCARDRRVFVPEGILTVVQTKSNGYYSPVTRGDYGGILPKDKLFAYYDYLFNRSVFKDCYITKDPASTIKKGVVVRTDIPCNMVAAASVAVRCGWEIPQRALSLLNMLEMGVEHNEAFIASFMMYVKPDGTFRTHKYTDHCCIYAYNLSLSGVANIKSGKLPNKGEYNTKLYKDVLSYSGVPIMWNNLKDSRSIGYPPSSERGNDYNPFNIVVEGASKPTSLSVEEALDIIFKECAR